MNVKLVLEGAPADVLRQCCDALRQAGWTGLWSALNHERARCAGMHKSPARTAAARNAVRVRWDRYRKAHADN